MEDVRNGCDKLVCRIDKSERLVEIVIMSGTQRIPARKYVR